MFKNRIDKYLIRYYKIDKKLLDFRYDNGFLINLFCLGWESCVVKCQSSAKSWKSRNQCQSFVVRVAIVVRIAINELLIRFTASISLLIISW